MLHYFVSFCSLLPSIVMVFTYLFFHPVFSLLSPTPCPSTIFSLLPLSHCPCPSLHLSIRSTLHTRYIYHAVTLIYNSPLPLFCIILSVPQSTIFFPLSHFAYMNFSNMPLSVRLEFTDRLSLTL